MLQAEAVGELILSNMCLLLVLCQYSCFRALVSGRLKSPHTSWQTVDFLYRCCPKGELCYGVCCTKTVGVTWKTAQRFLKQPGTRSCCFGLLRGGLHPSFCCRRCDRLGRALIENLSKCIWILKTDSLNPALSEVCKDWQKEHWCHSYDLETKFIHQNKRILLNWRC